MRNLRIYDSSDNEIGDDAVIDPEEMYLVYYWSDEVEGVMLRCLGHQIVERLKDGINYAITGTAWHRHTEQIEESGYFVWN